jgi:fumarate hydratase subunit alpha
MLKPADGEEGVKNFVVETVRKAGGNPCPPIIVGVGIGGSFDKCAYLAKKALLRKIGSIHPDPYYAAMEKELLQLVNNTGVGPQGLGGRTTALAVHIEVHPCHIASLPVAVNTQCHSARHKEIII